VRKKKVEIGLELLVMSISLIGLFFIFFALIMASDSEPEIINAQGFFTRVINDGHITSQELLTLNELSCEDIKMLLGTGKEVCIYFKDTKGNVADLSGDGYYGIGCPGLEIDGQRICNKG